jgi:hypothetical protein
MARPLRRDLRPALRSGVIMLAAIAGALAITTTLLVIPIGIYTIVAKPWRTTEQLVAFACGCIALVFVVVFPMVGLFSDWMYGATLSWLSGWLVMFAMFSSASAVQARAPRPGVAPVAGPSH